MNDTIKKYIPDVATWEITLKCNLNCLHCGSFAGRNRLDELSNKETIKLCNDLSDLGFKGITLMGGEVFLRKNWFEISKEIKDCGMALSIITNGYFKPDKFISDLSDVEVDCLLVGMDGATEETHDKIRNKKGCFKKSVNFVKKAKQENLPAGIITTVHTMNFSELPQIHEFVKKEKIIWQIQHAIPLGRFPKELLVSKEQYYTLGLYIKKLQNNYKGEKVPYIGNHNFGFYSKKIGNISPLSDWEGCIAGKSIIGIQSNGNIKGCLALSDNFIEGNIRKRSIKKIWEDPNSFVYTRRFDIDDIGENCNNCKHKNTCKGGCTTRSSTMTGKPHNDPYCFYKIENELKL